MSGHLQDNPEFDSKLQETLMQLQNKANTEVSRAEAQEEIDEAKEIIQEARMIVVGNDLSDDSTFKIQLIMGLLETAKVEYEEAVVDGIIEEIAEFQDGSAFVWQSQQIYENIESELDPIDSSRINGYYAEVWALFDQRADPADVENSIDSVIAEFEEISSIDSNPSDHEEILLTDMPPLKQIQGGVDSHNVTCKSGFELVFKPNGNPACVYLSSVEKLAQRGWNI
jgi:hypothetical protein